MIHSRFTAFFILTRTLMAIVPIAFIIAPIGVYFANVEGFEDQSSLPSFIVMATVMWPLVYLFIREYNIINIVLYPECIRVTDVLKRIKKTYPYHDICNIDVTIRRTEEYLEPNNHPSYVNDNRVFTIEFVNGDCLVIESDVYANSEKLYTTINSRRFNPTED